MHKQNIFFLQVQERSRQFQNNPNHASSVMTTVKCKNPVVSTIVTPPNMLFSMHDLQAFLNRYSSSSGNRFSSVMFVTLGKSSWFFDTGC